MLLRLAMLLFAQTELYVSVTGNDDSSGTARTPFRSLGHAIAVSRSQKIKRIVLRKGEYEISQSIMLGAADSGLTIEAAQGERPLLSGAKMIPASAVKTTTDPAILNQLSEPSAGPQIREIDLHNFVTGTIAPAAAYGFPKPIIPTGNELFGDGTPFILARWPNTGFAKIERLVEAGNGEDDANAPKRQPKFIASPERVKKWASAEDIWFYGYWKYDWADESILASKIDPSTGSVTLSTPHSYGLEKGAPFFAENLLQELDQPGEMYIDRKAGKLYFIPKAGTTSKLRLSLLSSPLMEVRDATKITVRGLDFGFARGDGIRITNDTEVRVEGCQFYNLGMRAAVIDGGKDSGLHGCNIWNMGEGGVSLSGGDRKTLMPAGNFVENCEIHHFQRRTQTYRPAVSINGVGNRVVHCSVHDAPHSAIIYGGNEHLIEFNEFYRTILRTGDGGVVYTGRDWTARGTQIRYNHFFDNIGMSKWEPAIYFDDLASGQVAKGNVIERCHWGFLVGGGRDHLIEDNVIVDCKLGLQCDARGLGWYAKNRPIMDERLNAMPIRSEVWSKRYPQLLTLAEDEPMTPKGNILRSNLLVRSGKLQDRTEPGFKKTAIYDRNIEASSVGAWQGILGAPKLPMEKMGLVRDKIRATLPK